MSEPDLTGLSVLVCRPAGQCEALATGIEAAGGHAVCLPAIEIEPVSPEPAAVRRLHEADSDDVAVFVSRNAVRHGARWLAPDSRPSLAAIGPSTLRALEGTGLPVDIRPDGFDSEALLAHPDLREMKGRRVFILRGRGGRETLARELSRRGAAVAYLEVYRRRRPAPPADAVAKLLAAWLAGGEAVYTATSVETLDNLVAMAGETGHETLLARPLVTASGRVVQRAQEIGHHGERLVASGPDDPSLIEALARWRAGRPATDRRGKEA